MARSIGRNRAATSQEDKSLGELRTSQLVTSYGIGAIVDFVNETAILGGIDQWPAAADDNDPRIIHCHNLEIMLNKKFFLQPRHNDKAHASWSKCYTKDIPAYRFPTMLYCPQCMRLIPDKRLVGGQKGELHCPFGCKSRLVATSFVAVCEHGHIEDFPYDAWVHQGNGCPCREDGMLPRLRLVHVEGRTNISSLLVKCEDCGTARGMQSAFAKNALLNLHPCSGKRPWLSADDPVPCSAPLQLRLRTSTAVYMPASVSALNIPPWSTRACQILLRYKSSLEQRDDDFILNRIRRDILPEMPGCTPEKLLTVWRDMERRNETPSPANERELYEEEYRALCLENAEEQSELYSHCCKLPESFASFLDQVMGVDRLTEIVALVGFTRLSGWSGNMADPNLAPISVNPLPWFPAVKRRGEGIFITLDEDRLARWEKQVQASYAPMLKSLESSFVRCDNASPRYVLLHTLSHLLIRALASCCGYDASSLKERIYATWPQEDALKMSGILIYTAQNDADGSLGGLVAQAESETLEDLLIRALEDASWCSADPLCMESFGEHSQGMDGLNYAACHQCALLPETSCCMRNSLLDRAALIGRETDRIMGYFSRER